MSETDDEPAARAARLTAALRANLRKRKDQARAVVEPEVPVSGASHKPRR